MLLNKTIIISHGIGKPVEGWFVKNHMFKY